MSPKSSEMLTNATDALELNTIHLLNWGSTRMAGFLDACIQLSKIIVPFLDTIIAGNIRPDETKYLASPKGLYLLQLFADIHPIFACKFLHNVGSDDVLICEVFNIANNTAEALKDPDIKTPKANALFESLSVD